MLKPPNAVFENTELSNYQVIVSIIASSKKKVPWPTFLQNTSR